MGGDAVIVAGFGFTSRAGAGSVRDALAACGGAQVYATVAEKAEALVALLGAPVVSVAPEALRAQVVATVSARSITAYGTGSVAEAAALAAAGPGARLLVPRKVSRDGQATCALAEGST